MQDNLNPNPPAETERNLFDNVEYDLVQAGSGKRLANYIIDLISFYVCMYLLSYVIIEVNYELAVFLYGDDGTGFDLVGRLVTLLLYGMYMGLVEAVFRGRSLGKIITGTVAVNQDGSRISGATALLRGLCRAVPFNAFSALGQPCFPWHDKWTKTYVVDSKSLQRD